MIPRIRTAIANHDLASANRMLTDLIRSIEFRQLVLTEVIVDIPFYNAALDRFIVKLVDASMHDDKREPAYGSIFPAEVFDCAVQTHTDLVTLFFHVALHEKCNIFWQRCSTRKSNFTNLQRDIIEEVYSQAILHIVAPTYHGLFADFFRRCVPQVTQPLALPSCNTVIEMMNYPYVSNYTELNELHSWLYSNDTQEQDTFNTFITTFDRLITSPGTVQLLFADWYYFLEGCQA